MTRIDLPNEKKVGHLTLIREARTITPKEFNALSFSERLAMVRGAEVRKKYQLILESHDAERIVQSLPAQDVYLMLKELGPADVSELVTLTNTGQFTTFVDLDCWKGDMLEGDAVRQWLSLLLEGGEDHVLQTALELEFELLVIMVKKQVEVLSGPEDLEDEDVRMKAVQRDGGYQLEYRDPEHAKEVGAFLDVIFRRRPDFYMQLMQAVRWESESQIEEEAYRFRAERLQEKGFPDPLEALSVYGYLDPDSFDPARNQKQDIEIGEEGVAPPGFVLTTVQPRDLLADVFDKGLEPEICWELTYLLNKVMIADRVDVGDAAQMEATLQDVYRYLDIALEHLCGTDAEEAARLFETVYLHRLFQLGFSLTLGLQRRAARLTASAIGPYLDGPYRAMVGALSHKKPQFFEGIEDSSRAGERSFGNLAEIRLVEKWLDNLEVQRRLFEEHFPFDLPLPEEMELEGCLPSEGNEVTLSELFLTALANRVMAREFVPVPIPAEELPALHGHVSADGKLDETLRSETADWLESLEPGGAEFARESFSVWEAEFCSLKPDDIDPRYVGGLIMRL